jgi:hypothetical protein
MCTSEDGKSIFISGGVTGDAISEDFWEISVEPKSKAKVTITLPKDSKKTGSGHPKKDRNTGGQKGRGKKEKGEGEGRRREGRRGRDRRGR